MRTPGIDEVKSGPGFLCRGRKDKKEHNPLREMVPLFNANLEVENINIVHTSTHPRNNNLK
jgi:hypothetical protein